jgi:hypothetical protein
MAGQRESTLTLSPTTVGAGEADNSGSDDERDENRRQRVELYRKAEIMRRVKVLDSKRVAEAADLGVCYEEGYSLIHRTLSPQTICSDAGVSIAGEVGVEEISNKEMMTPTDTWQVLNEVTVDRGSNAGMLQLELFVDGNHVTTILADGLVIATATGSTAYSVS